MPIEPELPTGAQPEFPTDTDNRADWEQLLGPEMEGIGNARPAVAAVLEAVKNGDGGKNQPYTIGLALSGGGIRSATVSLGVMQKLAQAGILKQVDYLSTVSGGGFIGSALTWWLRKREDGSKPYDTDKQFPYGIIDPKDPEPPSENPNAPLPLQYLRVQGKYLTPGNGITVWSGVAILLRAILLNLLVWIPVAALAALLLLWIGTWPILNGLPFLVNMAAPGLLGRVSTLTGSEGVLDATATVPPAFLLLLLIAGGFFVLFLFGTFNHSLLSWTNRTEASAPDTRSKRRLKYPWPFVLLIALVGLVILAAVALSLLEAGMFLFALGAAAQGIAYQPAKGVAADISWLVVAGLATILLNFVLRETGEAQTFSRKNLGQLWRVVIGLAAIVLMNLIVIFGIGPGASGDWWKRVSAFLQFAFGMGFLAYANYVVGLLIRHVLRSQAVGETTTPDAAAGGSFLEYHARRVFEWFFGGALQWSVVLVVIGILPLINTYIDYKVGGASAAIGLAFTFAGQMRARSAGHGRFTNLLLMVGAALFAYGIVLIGYRLALNFIDGTAVTRTLIAALFFAAVISGWFVNTNHIGLHRYYRDRLMEAFMPDDDTLGRETNGLARGANQFRVTEAWTDERERRPYHIVNTNLVLSNSKHRKFRLRGGDNFILSPLFIGSSATGWLRTKESENADMTLASAMAISGAAANPRGGAGGRGVTRSPSVAIAMSLLNIRLGYWIRNPKYTRPFVRRANAVPPQRRPNHFWPGGAYALSKGGYREDCDWLELADGGHFENLAVYELVRRRCGLIIVCDGGQDNASSYSDMVTAVQRIGQDFGAAVRFDMKVHDAVSREWRSSSPAQLIARSGNTDYPKGAEFADKGYFVATLDYGPRGGKGWPEKGTIVYLKSALIKELDVRAKGYRGAHPEFPNQTTGDQFFDEEQFEAYREVGFRICNQMIGDLDLPKLFAKGRPALAALRDNGKFKAA
jgi:hypothetical protein